MLFIKAWIIISSITFPFSIWHLCVGTELSTRSLELAILQTVDLPDCEDVNITLTLSLSVTLISLYYLVSVTRWLQIVLNCLTVLLFLVKMVHTREHATLRSTLAAPTPTTRVSAGT